jgi:hypothetical protein
MFTIRLMPGIFPGYVAVTAKAPTLAQALAFVGEFSELQSLIIEAPWIERNGRYVMDVFDWCACWFSDPPVMAQVIAPSGFTPAAERL